MRLLQFVTSLVLLGNLVHAGEPFTYDFADGVKSEFFRPLAGEVRQTKNGVEVTQQMDADWSSFDLRPCFQMHGDFDIDVVFDQLNVQGKPLQAGIMVELRFVDDRKQFARVYRCQMPNDVGRIQYQLSQLEPDGTRSHPHELRFANCTSGVLRLVRRGASIKFMLKAADQPEFDVYEREVTDASTTVVDGILLRTHGRGDATVRVVWKSMRIEADKLIYDPPIQSARQGLFVVNADGSDFREITAPLWGMSNLGSPEWSPNGERICYDTGMGTVQSSHLASINVDGTDPRDHGMGCMPSYSRDSNYFVYTQPGPGIMRMDLDGTFRESIHRSGWGAQWSPDGQYIAYGKSNNIVLLNVDTEEERMLFNPEQAERVGRAHWNFGWSHDSRSIALKSRNPKTKKYEIIAADIDDFDGFQVLSEDMDSRVDFTFTPDNRKVLFGLKKPDADQPRLVTLSRDNPGVVEDYPNMPEGYAYYHPDFSPDGRIVFVGMKVPQPTVWGK